MFFLQKPLSAFGNVQHDVLSSVSQNNKLLADLRQSIFLLYTISTKKSSPAPDFFGTFLGIVLVGLESPRGAIL